jgi:uncharacterized metal-binding protein
VASGKRHDLSIAVMLLPLTAIEVIILKDWRSISIVTISFLIGGTWLSPDIDLKQSRPSQRLSFLSGLWYPYRKLSGHRGFSHIPILGTLSRIFYILLPLIIYNYYFSHLNIIKLAQANSKSIELIFIGLEISAIVHLIMDYTPFLNKQ